MTDGAMPRGLDHIVHAVRDLDAAGELYARLGFTVGARNAHPWGTHNRIVQFSGFFIELLTIGEPEKIAAGDGRTVSFGAVTRDFLRAGEGFSMLVLESRDAEADARAFRAGGIGDFEPFHFEREGKKPDGTAVKVAFSLAFARDPQPTRAGFFVCQQHYPENFWNPAFQAHANAASAVAGAVMVADNPADHHIFLSAFVGERELETTSSGLAVKTPRGEIQVMDPAAFRIHFGIEPPDVAAGAALVALRIVVRDVDGLRAKLAKAGVAFVEHMSRLVIGPSAAMGAAIVFERECTGERPH
jgi:catechol 2,3-dioxygenase-like lactoylglutathione lyase family enzyme